LRCDLAERDEDEGAFGEAGVGNDKTGPTDNEVAIEQDVQVEGARAIGDAGGAVTPKVLFDEEQGAEEFKGGQVCLKRGGGIEKAGLLGEADGLGGVERGAGKYAAKGVEARSRGSQRGIWGSGGAGQVGAHSDVGGAHTATGYRESAQGSVRQKDIAKPESASILVGEFKGWMH